MTCRTLSTLSSKHSPNVAQAPRLRKLSRTEWLLAISDCDPVWLSRTA
jgi:hypothetical protein